MKSFLTVALLLSTLLVSAQTLTRDWKKGDSFEVSFTKTRQDDGGEVEREEDSTYTIEVIAADKTACTLRVISDHPLYEDEEVSEDDEDFVFDVPQDITYEIVLPKDAPGMTVTNWEAISKSVLSPFEAFEKELDDEDEFAQFFMLMFEAVVEPFRSQKGIEDMISQELRYLIDPYFLEFEGQEAITVSNVCPNPIKPELESHMDRVHTHSTDADGNTVITVTSDIDMSGLLAPMKDMIVAMATAGGDDMTDQDKANMEAKLAEIDAMEMTAVLTETYTVGKDNWPIHVASNMTLEGNEFGRQRSTIVEATNTLTRK
ncbi:MAG: hypothetical protein ACON34_11805 [Flavobacteriales bacterium]